MDDDDAADLRVDLPPVLHAPDHAIVMWQSPKYQRFVNMIMMAGKKQTARVILSEAMDVIRSGGHDPQEIFHSALENVRPMMEMRRMGNQQIPTPIKPARAEGQAMKWIVAAARKKAGSQKFYQKLAGELLAAHQNKGSAVQKKEEVHKTAVANQASAHFRWRVGGRGGPGAIDMDRKQYRPQGRRVIRKLAGAMH